MSSQLIAASGRIDKACLSALMLCVICNVSAFAADNCGLSEPSCQQPAASSSKDKLAIQTQNQSDGQTRQTSKSFPEETPAQNADLASYMNSLQQQIKSHWYPPKGHKSKQIIVCFNVGSDGQISDLRIDRSSGVESVDQAALKAVEYAAPFGKPPGGFPDNMDIQFSFDYGSTR